MTHSRSEHEERFADLFFLSFLTTIIVALIAGIAYAIGNYSLHGLVDTAVLSMVLALATGLGCFCSITVGLAASSLWYVVWHKLPQRFLSCLAYGFLNSGLLFASLFFFAGIAGINQTFSSETPTQIAALALAGGFIFWLLEKFNRLGGTHD